MPKKEDLSGTKFGYLITIQREGSDKNRNPLWRCRCRCGKEAVVLGGNLKRGNTKSCGCLRREDKVVNDLTGRRYSRLLVVRYDSKDRNGQSMWLCRCDCGGEVVIRAGNLTRGITQSCGCYKKERLSKHGHSPKEAKSPTYQSWDNMIQRCTNPKASNYEYYGGCGVSVCARWQKSFKDFLEDMGEKPKGFTLERDNNNGNYEPGNCRWATWQEQRRNKRKNNQFTAGREHYGNSI